MDDEPVDVTAWTEERSAARADRVERRRAWKAQAHEEHTAARNVGLRRRHAAKLKAAGEHNGRQQQRRMRVEGDLWHGKVPEGAVYVGRQAPGLPRSPFANPFRVGRQARNAAHAVELYQAWLAARPELVEAAVEDIGQRDVACWCRLDAPCHGDVLLAFVRAYRKSEGTA